MRSERSLNWPAWIRTKTKWTKTTCATITPRANRQSGRREIGALRAIGAASPHLAALARQGSGSLRCAEVGGGASSDRGLSTPHPPPWRARPRRGPESPNRSSTGQGASRGQFLRGWGTCVAASVLHARPALVQQSSTAHLWRVGQCSEASAADQPCAASPAADKCLWTRGMRVIRSGDARPRASFGPFAFDRPRHGRDGRLASADAHRCDPAARVPGARGAAGLGGAQPFAARRGAASRGREAEGRGASAR